MRVNVAVAEKIRHGTSLVEQALLLALLPAAKLIVESNQL